MEGIYCSIYGEGESLFPLKICLCPLPEIAFKRVVSFLIPKMVYISLFPKIFCLCSSVPQFKLAMFQCSLKPVGRRLSLIITKCTNVVAGRQGRNVKQHKEFFFSIVTSAHKGEIPVESFKGLSILLSSKY